LLEADRISFIYQLMVSGTGFNAAQTRSARCLAEDRHPSARQICPSDFSQCCLAGATFSQLFRETVFGWDPDVGKRFFTAPEGGSYLVVISNSSRSEAEVELTITRVEN